MFMKKSVVNDRKIRILRNLLFGGKGNMVKTFRFHVFVQVPWMLIRVLTSTINLFFLLDNVSLVFLLC